MFKIIFPESLRPTFRYVGVLANGRHKWISRDTHRLKLISESAEPWGREYMMSFTESKTVLDNQTKLINTTNLNLYRLTSNNIDEPRRHLVSERYCARVSLSTCPCIDWRSFECSGEENYDTDLVRLNLSVITHDTYLAYVKFQKGEIRLSDLQKTF